VRDIGFPLAGGGHTGTFAIAIAVPPLSVTRPCRPALRACNEGAAWQLRSAYAFALYLGGGLFRHRKMEGQAGQPHRPGTGSCRRPRAGGGARQEREGDSCCSPPFAGPRLPAHAADEPSRERGHPAVVTQPLAEPGVEALPALETRRRKAPCGITAACITLPCWYFTFWGYSVIWL